MIQDSIVGRIRWETIQFNTLLMFVDQIGVNAGRSKADPYVNFVKMTLGLAASLKRAGKSLRVFTNSREILEQYLRAERHPAEDSIEVREVIFPQEIPMNIRFYAGHHKIYLYSHFAAENAVNCLLDADMVFAADAGRFAERILGSPDVDGWIYDISDQEFPAYGSSVVQQDLKRLGSNTAFPRWYGGEFIIGTEELYGVLNDECQRLLPSYLDAVAGLHHVGDEALVSASLNNCLEKLRIAEAGCCGLVLRFWSRRTLHVQKRVQALQQAAFWHLPGSKSSLGAFSQHQNQALLYRNVATKGYLANILNSFRPVQGSRQADKMRN